MNLKLARKIAGLTQHELAERVGITDSYISLIESGRQDICDVGYGTVVRLAHALGVEPHELFPVPDAPPSALTETRGAV